ncbi:hypothetical protein PMAA_042290 [Talaromyces marneffei ATCC 18224]|uniref:Uncharacterized protein n=1 Tax=Talaromyces marneffei (strain ATCC 18224 / CBS 334.59 / QM 7333) TaxID=441960 RepID=B6QQJ9_TALMQ|nr:hypothetical protein PMAA_042290 [Talaromyces marneffei ATCC 18224]
MKSIPLPTHLRLWINSQDEKILDAGVANTLPEFKEPRILTGLKKETGKLVFKTATNTITLRRMLTQMSGIGYDFLTANWAKWRAWRGEELDECKGVEQDRNKAPFDELGDSGLYGYAIDYIKVFISLLKKDGELWKPETWKKCLEAWLLNREDVLGVCKKGTLTGDGLRNLYWWIDRPVGWRYAFDATCC